MAMGEVVALDWLSAEEITPVIRRQSGDDGATIIAWTHDRLVGGGEGIGVWRVAGVALVDGRIQQWSIVLKGWNAPATDADPTSFNWPHREMELYRSGLLADLPGGIRAPACFGDMQRDDGSVWVWLEDITDADTGLRSLDQYAVVARRLGQFNGAWTVDRPLPDHPALSQDWTRQWVEAAGPHLSLFVQETDNPFIREVYPPHVVEAYMRLWENRRAAYALLDRLPKAFCHLDAFSRNIFTRGDPGDPDDIILIDWSFAGIAALGEEVSSLIVASAVFMETPAETIGQLYHMALDAYIEGLRDAGWRGDAGLIREACRVAFVLRHGVGAIRLTGAIHRGEWPHADIEQMIGHPFEEINTNLAVINRWLVDLLRDER